MLDKAVSNVGNVNKSVLMNTNVNKGTKVNNALYSTFQNSSGKPEVSLQQEGLF